MDGSRKEIFPWIRVAAWLSAPAEATRPAGRRRDILSEREQCPELADRIAARGLDKYAAEIRESCAEPPAPAEAPREP
jgi:hypothetical protein